LKFLEQYRNIAIFNKIYLSTNYRSLIDDARMLSSYIDKYGLNKTKFIDVILSDK